jgi:hypothetical protein
MQAFIFYYNLFLFLSTQVVGHCEQQQRQLVVVLVVPGE